MVGARVEGAAQPTHCTGRRRELSGCLASSVGGEPVCSWRGGREGGAGEFQQRWAAVEAATASDSKIMKCHRK